MNDWSMVLLDLDTCVDLCLYIFSLFFSLFKRAFQISISKNEKRVEKVLLRKLVKLGKCGANMY